MKNLSWNLLLFFLVTAFLGGSWKHLPLPEENDIVFITEEDPCRILPIDITRGIEGASIPLDFPSKILAISEDGKEIYIAAEDSYGILSVDIASHTVQKLVSLEKEIHRCVLSKNGKRGYISYKKSNALDCVHLRNREVLPLVALEKSIHCMILDPVQDVLYLSCEDSNEILSLDLNSLKVGTFFLCDQRIDALAITQDGSKILAFHEESDQLTKIDRASKSIDSLLQIENLAGSQIEAIGFNQAGTDAYIVKENSHKIVSVNLKRNELGPSILLNHPINSIGFYPKQALFASFKATPGAAGEHSLFDASETGPEREGELLYVWDFGDGVEAVSNEVSISHIYDFPGEFVTTLTGVQNTKNPLSSEKPIQISSKVQKSIEISHDFYFAKSSTRSKKMGSIPSSTVGTPSQSSLVIGGSVFDSAVVTGTAAAGSPTGTVTFFVGVTQIGSPVTLTPGANNTATASSISYTPAAPGNYQFTAAYSGDSNYTASSDSSSSNAFTVTQGTTSTSLASSVNPTIFGNPTTLTATISILTGSGPLSGTVTFFNAGTSIGTGPVSGGTANLNVSNLSVASHSLTATYNGNTDFTASPSPPVMQVVNQGTTTSTLTSSIPTTTYGESTTFKATVAVATGAGTPTGHFTFFNGATVIGTVNLTGLSASLPLSTLPVGSNSITAVYSGDTNFVTSTSLPVNQQVNQATPVITLASSLNPSNYGTTVTFTSTVSAPTTLGVPSRTVTFYDGASIIGSGTLVQTGTNTSTATFALNSLSGGTHSITAEYSSDTNFIAVTSSPALSQNVILANTSVTLFSTTSNPTEFGQPVTLQANVIGSIASPPSGPSGTVTFYDGSTPIGTVAVSMLSPNTSFATLTLTNLAIGAHSFTADYSGDVNYNPVNSNTIPHTVIMASTSTATTTSGTPSVFGQLVTFTATVSPNNPGSGNPTGTVQFYNGINLLGTGTLSPSGPDFSQATFQVSSLALGSHSILSVYLGDTDFSDSTAPLITQVVIQDATTTNLSTDINPSQFGEEITLSAAVTANAPGSGTPTGTVTFYNGATEIGTGIVNGSGIATFSTIALYPGFHFLTAIYSGDTNYLTSNSTPPYSQDVINQLPTITTIASGRNSSPTDQAVTYTATVTAITGIPTGTVSFYDNGVFFGTGTLNAQGVATVTEPASDLITLGLHPITAIYSGDPNFIMSPSAIFDQYVVPYDTSTLLTTTPNHSEQANALLTATVTATGTPLPIPPFTGTVTFYQNGMAVSPPVAVDPTTGIATYMPNDFHFGSTTVIAVYSGDDTTFATSTSNPITQQVQQTDMLTTATVLSSSLSTSYFCQPITLTATVTETQGFYTPTGSVAFYSDGVAIGASILNSSGVATLSVSTLSIGTHTLTATYNSDSNYAFSFSNSIIQTVIANPTTTTLAIIPNLSSTPYGQTLTFVMNVQSTYGIPTGVVNLSDESGEIATANIDSTGLATYVTSALPAGIHTFTATYDPNCCFTTPCFQASSSTLNNTITLVDADLVLTATPSPSIYGNTITLQGDATSYSVGTPTGTVTFYDGSTLLGTAPIIEGFATLEVTDLPAGVVIFNATYSGDSNFISKNFPSRQEVINKAPVAISLISFSPDPSEYGQPVTFSATLTSLISIPTGTVTFFSGATNLGQATLNGSGVATLQTSTLLIGTSTITAVYSGDSNFLTATSSNFSQIVTKSATLTTITSSLPNPSTFNSSITVALSVAPINPGSGTPTGTITGSYGSVVLGTATLSNGTASFTTSVLPAGTQTITAVYGGDTNFTGSQGLATHTVNGAATSIAAITSSVNPSVFGQAVTLSTIVSSTAGIPGGIPGGTATFYDGTVQIGIATLDSSGNAVLTTSALAVGTHSITVKYLGLGNFAASTSAALSQVVNQSATTTSLNANMSTSNYGETVTFTADVIPTSPGAGTPTGTITFKNGATTLGIAPLTSGIATFSIASLAASATPYLITATYSGDTNFTSSIFSSFSLTVMPATTITTAISSPNPSVLDQLVTLTITVDPINTGTVVPNGTVTASYGATTIGTGTLNANGTITFTTSTLPVGTLPILISYAGNSNFSPSSGAVIQEVTQGTTTTSLISSLNPSYFGEPVTFTATVSPSLPGTPTGTVSFFDGSTLIGTQTLSGGAASLTTSHLSLGTHNITAAYSGDSNFGTSTSAVLTQNVVQATTSTTLTSSVNPSNFGQTILLTASINVTAGSGTPTGTVTFLDGATPIGTGTVLNGQATLSIASLAVEAHSLTAVYGGDSNFATSTSTPPLIQNVILGTTTTTLTSSINPSTFEQTILLTATLDVTAGSGIPTGMVTFLDGATPIGTGTVVNGQATLSISILAVGAHSLTAAYSGDSNFATSTSTPPLIQNVIQADSAVALTSSLDPSYFGQNILLTATVQGVAVPATPSGSITFYDGPNVIGSKTLSGGVATLNIASLTVGNHSLTASYSGDTNFAPATSPLLAQVVLQGTTATTLNSSLNPSIFGNAVTFTANVAPVLGVGTPTGMVIFTDGTAIIGTAALTGGAASITTSILAVGTHPIAAIYNGDDNFETSTSSVVSQVVNLGNKTTTLSSSINPSIFEQPVTLTAQIAVASGAGNPTGFVTFYDGAGVIGISPLTGDFASLTVSDLSVGTHSLTAVYSGDDNFATSTSSILTQIVNKESSATNILSISPSPSLFGQNVTFFAAVTTPTGTPPTGTLTFYDGAMMLGTVPVYDGIAVFATPILSIGTHLITATYNGDSNFLPSTSSPPVALVVNPTTITSTTITTLTSSLNPSNFGDLVTFDITVAPISGPGTPTGVVTLYSGTVPLATLTLVAGQASYSTSTLPAGTSTIVALYSGDSNFSSSTATLAQVVNPIGTNTTISSSVNPSIFDQAVIFSSTVTSTTGPTPTGSVSFYDGASLLGTTNLNPLGSATFTVSTLMPGSHTITAVYNPSPDFATSSNTLTQVVNEAPTVTAILTSSPNPSNQGDLVSFIASVTAPTGIPTGTVTFYDGATPIRTVPLDSGLAIFALSTLTPGTHTITAVYNGDGNYAPSPSLPYIQIVNSGLFATTTTVSSSLNPAQLGLPVTFTAQVLSSIGIPAGTVTFFDGALAIGTALLNNGLAQITTSTLALGDHNITAVYSGNTLYSPSTSLPLVEVIITSTAPLAPQNFYGYQVINKFLNDKVRVNILNWSPPQDSGDIIAFEIYRDPALTDLVGRVCNKFPFQLEDPKRKKNVVYTYYIVSVNQGGIKSPAVSADVKPLEKCKD
jgi:hypothetical protein